MVCLAKRQRHAARTELALELGLGTTVREHCWSTNITEPRSRGFTRPEARSARSTRSSSRWDKPPWLRPTSIIGVSWLPKTNLKANYLN